MEVVSLKKSLNRMMIPIFVLLIVLFTLSACSDDNNDNGNNNNNDITTNDTNIQNDEENQEIREDITIKWVYPWGEDRFMDIMGNDIEEQFPHVTIEVLDANADHPETLEDLLAASQIPDIITVGQSAQISILNDMELAHNLDELIEKTGFDLERLEPTIVQYVRNQDPNQEGGLYAIPHSRPMWALHYDKDIFDILGVEYPTDGMTWEEVLELAKEVTREVGGVQYRGLDLDVWGDSLQQFSINTVDPDTDEPLIAESEEIRRFLEYIKAVVEIPGNYDTDEPSSMLHHWGGLLEEGNVAMYPSRVDLGALSDDSKNIDIVTYPSWEGYENINPNPNGAAWIITEQSELKEEALEIVEYLLSDEVQLEYSRDGDVEGGGSVLVNSEIHEEFGANDRVLASKSIPSLFINEYATGPERKSKYSDGVLWTAPNEFADSDKDVNDFMRELQEKAEENVRSSKEQE